MGSIIYFYDKNIIFDNNFFYKLMKLYKFVESLSSLDTQLVYKVWDLHCVIATKNSVC